MKRLFRLLTLASLLAFVMPAEAQLVTGKRGSDDFRIGVAGYTYRKFDIDRTLEYLQSMGVKYLSVKDFWLPLDSTAEQMEAFKAKCAAHGVDGYILGPIYMRNEADVDRAFAYAERYGSDVFIGVPTYELIDYVIAKVADTGIKVAIHTHGPDGQPFPNIQKVVELVKDPKLGVGCCMDLGHSVRMGEDIVKDIKKYKDWIYDILEEGTDLGDGSRRDGLQTHRRDSAQDRLQRRGVARVREERRQSPPGRGRVDRLSARRLRRHQITLGNITVHSAPLLGGADFFRSYK